MSSHIVSLLSSPSKQLRKLGRAENVNRLIVVIGSLSRRFFHHNGTYAWMSIDERGKIWFTDDYSGKYIYTHYKGNWKHFTHGGTLKDLIIRFREYIQIGKKVPLGVFGPWPEWVCDGDLWGYGQEPMEIIREKAVCYGICDNGNSSAHNFGTSA